MLSILAGNYIPKTGGAWLTLAPMMRMRNNGNFGNISAKGLTSIVRALWPYLELQIDMMLEDISHAS
jgi:hypothetical protein